jgi:hypothetical protein
VRTFIDLPSPIIVHPSTPKNDPALVIGSLKLDPNIKSINRSSGEEVAQFSGAHNCINTKTVAATHCRANTV